MAWFRRRKGGPGVAKADRAEQDLVRRHLAEFVGTRRGVEAFIEPPTTVTPPTVLLVASTGEWTRRRVQDKAIVRELAERLRVPVYDVQLVGYPQRMRDWNERVKRGERPPAPDQDDQLPEL